MSQEETVRFLRRDILLLCALGVCAICLYLVTRAAAARMASIDRHVAATWYADGMRRFTSGDVKGAIESFKRATAIDRENRRYVLAMADALAAANHNTEAQQALQQLREADPTNAQINLHLARLAAKRGNIPEAVLYYHSALDGMWAGPEAQEQRRNIRIELVQFLIARNDENRALSELAVVDAELPNKAGAYIQVAKLFQQVDDAHRALNDFTEALRLDPRNVAAMAGAGEAAFQLGDYPKARHYLEDATAHGETSPQTAELLSLVHIVTSYDPLAPGLGAKERQRRLSLGLNQATQRLDQCLSKSDSPDLEALKSEAEAMQGEINSITGFLDPAMISSGLGLIYRIENVVDARCGAAGGADEALLLIGHKHGDTQ